MSKVTKPLRANSKTLVSSDLVCAKQITKIPLFVKNGALGALAGIVGVSSVYPVDLVKTRLQAQVSGRRSAIKTATSIFRNEGILGFYKVIFGVQP